MSNTPTRAQLMRQNLTKEAQLRGIQINTPISRKLTDGERTAFEQQLAQVRTLLSLDMNDREFIDSALSHNQPPESYHEYLSKREASLSEQLHTGAFYYNLPTNEFVDYISDNCAMLQSNAVSMKQTISEKSKQFKIATACACVLGCVSLILACKLALQPTAEPTPSPVISQSTSDTANDTADSSNEAADVPVDTTPQLQPLPYPANGTILVNSGLERVAPLTVNTEEGLAYYIKLCDMNGNEVLGFFAGPSATVDVDVPLGTYELRYACGTAWYGTTPKFGKDTQYFKTDTLFDFTEDSEYTHGYTVTLYGVPDGNMNTEEISEDDF